MSPRRLSKKREHDPASENLTSPPTPSNPIMERMVDYAIPLVGLVGAALYGMLRLAYLFFYVLLRASPEEVGYGYSQVLADELIGAIELVFLVALIILIPGAIMMLSLQLPRSVKKLPKIWSGEKRLSQDDRLGLARWTVKVRRLAVWSLAAAVPIVLVGLPILGWLEGQQAANGYTVRNVYLADFVALPVLAVEAVPARVSWVAESGASETDIADRECLLYLGQSDGTAVFYDVQFKESIRLPEANIIITLQNYNSVPTEC
jgi:hypothetical protein